MQYRIKDRLLRGGQLFVNNKKKGDCSLKNITGAQVTLKIMVIRALKMYIDNSEVFD